MGTLVVREMNADGSTGVFFMDDDEWTLHTFQCWMLGMHGNGIELSRGLQRNEILAYYPWMNEDEAVSDMYSEDPMWRDPDDHA